MTRQKRNFYYIYVAVTCIVICIAGILTTFYFNTKTTVVAESAKSAPTDLFSKLSITGRAAIVYDMTSNTVLYAKNADAPMPLASLTKIMTAITATTLAPTSTIVTIRNENLAQDGDTGLFLNEKWTLENLLKFSLVVSSNDGADAVATSLGSHEMGTTPDTSRQQFVIDMNKEASAIGLQHALFYNATGLDLDATHAGAFASARDVVTMLLYADMHDFDIFRPTASAHVEATSLSGFRHTGNNTDILTAQIPHLIIGKTGYTDIAGGNLAVLFKADPDNELVIVVLGSTYEDRFADVGKLATTSVIMLANNN